MFLGHHSTRFASQDNLLHQVLTAFKMFRTAFLRSARSATAQIARTSGAIARPVAPSSLLAKTRFTPSAFQAARCYSAAAGLSKPEVEGRIVDLLKNFDKVSAVPEFVRGCVDISPRFPIQQRYITAQNSISGFLIDRISLRLTPTLQTILVWTV